MLHFDCTIRDISPGDADVIDALIAEMAAEFGHGSAKRSSPADFARALEADPPQLAGLLVECEGQAVGLCLWFDWFSTWRGSLGVYVQDLYLTPRMRRSGLGEELLKQLMQRARLRGATFVRLAMDRDNDAALAFYGRLGFVACDREIVLELGGEALTSPAETPDTFTERTRDTA